MLNVRQVCQPFQFVCREEEETEFDYKPRSSERENLHYLLPLKSKYGLIQVPAAADSKCKDINVHVSEAGWYYFSGMV